VTIAPWRIQIANYSKSDLYPAQPETLRQTDNSSQAVKQTVIQGKQVFLRCPVRHDLSAVVKLNRESRALHRGLVSPPKDTEQFKNFLERCSKDDCVCFLVCRNEDQQIVGFINLSQIFHGGFRSAYLGYYVGSPHANQGYMTEALQLALRYAFKDLKLHRLEANIQPGNLASIAMVKRAGFVREGFSRRYLKICGRWRDHERWAIIAEDWQANRKASRFRS
jgi:ribosomal-protein-alanine N-acetyltransferase